MGTTKVWVVVGAALGLAGCRHVEAFHNLCGGTTACAKDACAPVDILSGRPNRPFRPLGVVQVRVDRGTAASNPTLRDAIPALENEARAMGADAVILTFEEFSNWYDKGEEAAPIHDLERQETWYITEKARYLSGLAVVYTGPCVVSLPAPPRPGAPGVVVTRQAGPITVVSPTAAPAPAPAPAPPAAPESMPVAPTSPAPAPSPAASGGGAVTISAPVPAGPLPPPRHVR